MKKNINRIIITALAGLSLSTAFGESFNWHVTGGTAFTAFQSGGRQDILIDTNTINSYSIQTSGQTNPLFGAGLAYQFSLPDIALDLGLTGLYTQSTVSGTNYPGINDGNNYPTLNYSATGNSYAVLFEPKVTLITYCWQPYFLAGIGVAWNSMNSYQETPTDPNGFAAPTPTPFNSATTSNLAYEFGAGVQRAIWHRKNSPILALDYRFINWGNTALSTFNGQPSSTTLQFGAMTTQSFNFSLIWPI